MQFFTGAFNEDYQISEEIRNGLINQFLLKPIDYFLYRLSIFFSARTVSGSLVLVPLAAALFLFHGRFAIPEGGWRLAYGLPALAMSALIQFSIAYCFGMLTFWLLEIQGLVILSMAVESVLGGQLFPLDLLPPAVFRASQFLPFYYQTYFPAAIFSGRIDRGLAAEGLCLQAFWTLALSRPCEAALEPWPAALHGGRRLTKTPCPSRTTCASGSPAPATRSSGR